MEIKLNWLKLTNFQGAKSLKINPMGKNIAIYGNNGTGKTTVANAFHWLLFNKNGEWRTDFEIKTLDRSGKPISGLDHVVEAEIECDGKPIILKKTYSEKWVKRRGQTEKEFTGNETHHEIDGVPVKKTDYDRKIKEIADEEQFKLLTSPTYFNSLHWEKRRKILVEAFGDVPDDEIFESSRELSSLKKEIGDRSVDDHRKVIKASHSKINKSLEEIPHRIDELSRTIPEDAGDKIELSKKLAQIKTDIEKKQKTMSAMEAADRDDVLLREKYALETKLSEIEKDFRKTINDDIEKLDKRGVELSIKLGELEKFNRDAEDSEAERMAKIDQLSKKIESIEDAMAALRDEYYDVDSTSWDGDEYCQTCGQKIPEDEIAAAKEKFNINRAEKLESINKKGSGLKAEKESIEKEIEYEKNKGNIEFKPESEIEPIRDEIKKLSAEIDDLHVTYGMVKELPGYTKVKDEILDIESRICAKEMSSPKAKEIEKLTDEISTLEQKSDAIRAAIAISKQADKSKTRIKELKAKAKTLSAEYEKLEKELFLCELFEKKKAEIVEDKVSGFFDEVRFKMFDIQINGGIKATCETIVDGVPYSSGLNSGSKLNAGIDIINGLSVAYDVSAPIFVDNAESVTDIIPSRSQMIKLIVSEKDNRLRVEA